jgi:hypothetical protein
VGEVGQVPALQFPGVIAKQALQSGVDLEEPFVGGEQGHSHPAVLEEQAEPFLRIGIGTPPLPQRERFLLQEDHDHSYGGERLQKEVGEN